MTTLNTIIEEEKAKNKAIVITVRLENEVFHGRFSSSTLECIEKIIAEEITSAMQRAVKAERVNWLRSEIEKLESEKKPLTKSMYGTLHLTEKDFAYNQALTTIITRYKKELLELDSKEV